MTTPARKKTPSSAQERQIRNAELDLLRQKTTQLTLEKLEKAAVILSQWIKEPPRRGVRK